MHNLSSLFNGFVLPLYIINSYSDIEYTDYIIQKKNKLGKICNKVFGFSVFIALVLAMECFVTLFLKKSGFDVSVKVVVFAAYVTLMFTSLGRALVPQVLNMILATVLLIFVVTGNFYVSILSTAIGVLAAIINFFLAFLLFFCSNGLRQLESYPTLTKDHTAKYVPVEKSKHTVDEREAMLINAKNSATDEYVNPPNPYVDDMIPDIDINTAETYDIANINQNTVQAEIKNLFVPSAELYKQETTSPQEPITEVEETSQTELQNTQFVSPVQPAEPIDTTAITPTETPTENPWRELNSEKIDYSKNNANSIGFTNIVGIYTKDIEAAKIFYEEFLSGSVFKETDDENGYKSCIMNFSGGTSIKLMTKPFLSTGFNNDSSTGLACLSFYVDSREKVEQLYEKITSAGFPAIIPPTIQYGEYKACVGDVDMNRIEFACIL